MDYLNYEGVAILWRKVKEKIASAISTKQDKITTSKDLHLSETNQLSLDTGVFKEWLISYAKGVLDIPYNRTTGYFECNGLNDLTEKDVLNIMYSCLFIRNTADGNNMLMFSGLPMRTLPTRIKPYAGGAYSNCNRMFQGCSNLETIDLSRLSYQSNISMMFRFCTNLHTIKGMRMANVAVNTGDAFLNCVELQNIELAGLHTSISFQSCPLLTRQSIEYIISHSTNTTSIGITLHHDVMVKIVEDIETADYTPVNLITTVSNMDSIEFPDNVATLYRSALGFKAKTYPGTYLGKGQNLYLIMDVEGMDDGEELTYMVMATSTNGDMYLGEITLQNGRSDTLLSPDIGGECSEIRFEPISSNLLEDASALITISNIKIAFDDGEGKYRYTPPLTTVTDEVLLEKIKWANLRYLASSRNIELVTYE